VSLGHPTLRDPRTYESQQFGPVPYNTPGYFSQPGMYALGSVVAWYNPYKGWPYVGHFHNGLDVAGPSGFPLRALETGVVQYKGLGYIPGTDIPNGGGLVIRVEIRPGTTYTFNHCSGFAAGVDVGDRVAKGQVIAYIGQTGVATGNHVHTSLDIDERGPDGVTRRLAWNPVLFMPGGAYANDYRIQPLSSTPAPLPPSPIPSMEASEVALRYRPATGSRTVRAGKPYRTKATVAQAPAGYFREDTTVRLIGQFDKTGSFDVWYLVDWYRGNGYGQAIVTSVDFK
jgi:hypothetical protein